MKYTDLVGHALDGKYQVERELGSGGMGKVYLATHLGTERPVAIKVIAPQFMQRAEFVERFRREARAAGRLRHPNVVDVTDFGFANTEDGAVAYLVMEYLDGCTLGEILDEEKNLPVSWTLDILEQVCSAVHEAHQQGIVHRDLKPDNIWLEPNQRGGYTVKVLDFGIAKLEASESAEANLAEMNAGRLRETDAATMPPASAAAATSPGSADHAASTAAGADTTLLIRAGDEGATILRPLTPELDLPSETRVFPAATNDSDSTRLLPAEDAEPDAAEASRTPAHEGLTTDNRRTDLTRVGAVLGTPLYMSPEQCRGERLDARSDIYSLGVIAYQMLSGETPFRGDFTRVMESHKFLPVPPLKTKHVRTKLRQVIESSLAKDREDRPQSAESFANLLRARTDGILGLLRRASVIYTEHIQKFLTLSTLFFLPLFAGTLLIVTFSFLGASDLLSANIAQLGFGLASVLNFVATTFSIFMLSATITWIVMQTLAVPLRPITLRPAITEALKRWKSFLFLGFLCTVLPIAAAIIAAGLVGGVVFGLLWLIFGASTVVAAIAIGLAATAGALSFFTAGILITLVAPVSIMEGLKGVKAIKRSGQLVARSRRTVMAAYFIIFLIPTIAAGTLTMVAGLAADDLEIRRPQIRERTAETRILSDSERAALDKDSGIQISFGGGTKKAQARERPPLRERLIDTLMQTLLQILMLPTQILIVSFTSIIIALLYLKTRQAGGESMRDLMDKFEEADAPRKKWQERVRSRLAQSGRVTSRS